MVFILKGSWLDLGILAFSVILSLFLEAAKLFIIFLMNLVWQSFLLELSTSLGAGQLPDSFQRQRCFVLFFLLLYPCHSEFLPLSWLTVFDELSVAKAYFLSRSKDPDRYLCLSGSRNLFFQACTIRGSFISVLSPLRV